MKKSPKKATKKRITLDDIARTFANSFSEFNGRMDKMEDKMDSYIAQTAEGFGDVDKRFDALEADTHRRITLVESTVAGMMKREVKK